MPEAGVGPGEITNVLCVAAFARTRLGPRSEEYGYQSTMPAAQEPQAFFVPNLTGLFAALRLFIECLAKDGWGRRE
jgi:hypothetical protein